MYKKVLPTISH